MEMRILQPTEIVAKRPFTHPRHTAQDLVAFRYMIDQPCLLLETPDRYAHLEPPYILFQTEADDRQQRFVISKTEQFAVPNRALTVVGFFGQKRRPVSEALAPILEALDTTLLDEFANHPHLYRYSTIQLESGDYANLVIFGNEVAIGNWGHSAAHVRAALEVSPKYYESIRLYNGRLPLGLIVSNLLHLSRIKYYDFAEQPMWRAVREISTGGVL